MAETTISENERRITRLEYRVDRHDTRIGSLEVTASSLQAWRTEEQARHSSAPAWLFGTISAGLMILALVFQYWLISGGGAP